MEKINNICLIIVFGIICFIIGYCIADNNNSKTDYNNVILSDTTYNKVILDSIKYNIHKKDSTIVELKKRTEYEMEQVINANDSVAIEQFKELAGQTNDSIISTGDWLKADTIVAVVPINLIKQANAKMIERFYLLEVVNQQDTIINMKDKYINEQQRIITDFQKRVNDTNKLNETIKKDLDKQKKRNKIITYGAGSIILGLIIGLIAK